MYPPTELICLAAIAREWHQLSVSLLDAIAENLSVPETIQKVKCFDPHVIVCLTGFECFEEDINVIRELKESIPGACFVVFGHYATEFPEAVLDNSGADFVILGEPDLAFDALLSYMDGNEELKNILAIAYRDENSVLIKGNSARVPDPNDLPMPAYDLLDIKHYSEPFLSKPFGLIQTARGCPYKCNYCVRSFGVKLTALSPERIMEHIRFMVKHHGIRSLRFIDDTFTATPARVVRLCKLMLEENLNLEWSCLSRADTLNRDMLQWMKKAGCKRLYFGIESGSQRILDLYEKGIDASLAMENLQYCHKIGFDTVGLFMVGHPEETEEDVQESVRFAHKAGLSFVAVSGLMFYPGTNMYKRYSDKIDFNIYPYRNRFCDSSLEDRKYTWEKKFYQNFYYSPRFVFNHALRLFSSRPLDFIKNLRSYLEYSVLSLTGKNRKDLI